MGVPLHGGGASKVSGDFEEDWTLFMMLDLVSGQAEHITIEVPGTPGWGFEFRLGRGPISEWHQVKYQNGSLMHWTLAQLEAAEVLAYFRAKLLGDPNATCWFISADGAAPLSRLCERAQASPTFADFVTTMLSSDKLREAFHKLRDEYWKRSEPDIFEWLKGRIEVESITQRALTRSLHDRARTYLTGAPSDSVNALRGIKRDSPYFPLTAEDLDSALRTAGHPPRPWSDDVNSPADAARETAQVFRTSVAGAHIGQRYIPRPELTTIQALLDRAAPPSAILITGLKGHGKSSLVGEVVSWALGSPWEVLAMDTTQLSYEQDAAAVGRTLGLPDTPAATLAVAASARNGRGLLVIDALDGVALNREKPFALFSVIGDVMTEARAHPHLTLLVSCRTEDLRTDDRLRSLVDEPNPAVTVDIPKLARTAVESALGAAGITPTQLSASQLALLRTPILLKYLVETKDDGPFDFESEGDIYQRLVGSVASQ
jgi:hypothetical protein